MRDIRYYIIQVYVPSVLIVTLSWVSFWLDLEAIPARVSLGVLTVLTLNTHGSNVQSSLPKVSYIKAIDVWTVTCLLFVFAALLEFAYVNVLARRGQKERKQFLKFSCLCEKVVRWCCTFLFHFVFCLFVCFYVNISALLTSGATYSVYIVWSYV